MANAVPTAPPILLVFLINLGPLIVFIILYALDFFNLVREGVYTEEDSPIGDLIFIFLVAIVGIPYALIRRRRAIKFHYEQGGKPLGGKYIFFNVAFGVVLGVWALILVCSICSWIYVASQTAAQPRRFVNGDYFAVKGAGATPAVRVMEVEAGDRVAAMAAVKEEEGT